MDSRSTFLLQVLEKLASPLVASISEVAVRQMMMPDPTQQGAMRPEAEQVASLLIKSTQLSIGLSDLIDMKLPDNEADSLRLALTSLASPLVANIYRLSGRTPTDQEVERVMSAMNAVYTYSENFTPAADASVRMATIEQDYFPADPAQVTLQYMSAILPAVNSIMAYSFGLPEKRLVQEVTERLLQEAKELRVRMFPDIKDPQKIAKADLAVLRMATLIYSQCHFGEMAKLMATEEQARQGLAPAMTTLWQAFSLRMQMLEILSEVIVPGGDEKAEAVGTTQTSSGGGGKAPDVAPVAQPAQAPVQAQPPSQQPAANNDSSGKSNPMSFFVKKNSA